jgi:hypothetical protein
MERLIIAALFLAGSVAIAVITIKKVYGGHKNKNQKHPADDGAQNKASITETTGDPMIFIEHHPNKDYCTFHVRHMLIEHSTIYISDVLGHQEPKDIPKKTVDLINMLREIPGLTGASIAPYCLSAEKGAAFRWGEIEPLIVAALKTCFVEEYREAKGEGAQDA